MKEIIKTMPIVGSLVRRIYRTLINPPKPFSGSMEYWQQRYESGGNSGAGSYNELAEFKANVLNCFVKDNTIDTVLEYGCGDGNQLKLAKYPSYIGYDVSAKVISHCANMFSDDETKQFKLMHEYRGEVADLTLSLDVIYHLIEDDTFNSYMERLFSSSRRFVIIYSSNTGDNSDNQALHVKHRRFSEWVETKQPQWKLLWHIPNKYPYEGDVNKGSFADFYIYERV